MADLAQWAQGFPGLVLPDNPFLAQAGDGGTVAQTAQPSAEPVAMGEGGNNTALWVLVFVVVVLIGLAVANLMRSRPGDGGERPVKPTREPADRPTRDVLDHRRTVDKVSEITEDDSLRVVKEKKMEKVKVASYEEAKRELQKRKAGQVKAEARRKRKRRKADEGASASDESADEGDEGVEAESDAVEDDTDGSEESTEQAESEADGAASDAEAPVAQEATRAEEDVKPQVEVEAVEEAPEAPSEDAPASTDAAPVQAPATTDPPVLAEPEPAEPPPIAALAGEPGAEGVIDPAALFGAPSAEDDGWGGMDFSGFSLAASESSAPVELARSVETSPAAAPTSEAPPKSEGRPAKAESKPPKAESRPPKLESRPAKTESKPAKAESKPPKAESKPPKSESRPAKTESKPAKADAKAAPRSGTRPALKPGKLEPRPPRADEPSPKSLHEGLRKTRGGFVDRLGSLFKRKAEIDEDLIDELEEVLYTADIGPKTAELLIDSVRSRLEDGEQGNAAAAWNHVKQITREVLTENDSPLELDRRSPFVILVVGVNGVGKTTTIGKLATRFIDEGRRVLLVAGDTFRAAATEQLEEWGERTGLPVHVGDDGSDPAAVVFDGIQRGVNEGYDVVICDTAGRLTNKKNLMKELEKIGRVAGKAMDGAPHETLLVLDANTGLMAIEQARMFQTVVDITGIVLTKLDGTAKGGVIIGICKELGVPVRFIGIGEGVYDLRQFDPHEFVEALFM